MRLLKKAAVEGHFVYAASVFRKLTWYLASSTSWHIFSAALRVRCNTSLSPFMATVVLALRSIDASTALAWRLRPGRTAESRVMPSAQFESAT